ncbi:hypothetical protein JNUCC23_01525 [Peribacillus sp. JNUCC 23]
MPIKELVNKIDRTSYATAIPNTPGTTLGNHMLCHDLHYI